MMRIAVYARVSRQPRQADQQGIEGQLERLFSHAQANEWEIGEELIFRDDGYSGSSANRPGLSALRAKASEGAIDLVLVTAPDRLARDYVWQRLLLEEFSGYGCRIEFLERPMDETPHDRLLLEIRGAVAEYERSLIAERMRQGRARKYRAGLLLPWSSRPPYGYRLDPEHPRDPQGVRIDEPAAAVVREIFSRYAEQDCTIYSLARWLEEKGVPSPKGKRTWPTSTIHSMLTNPAYTGEVFAWRMRSRSARGRLSPMRPVGYTGRSSEIRPPEEWIPVAEIPALVDAECFERIQQKLERNRKLAKRNNKKNTYLLRALVSCGVCGMARRSRCLHKKYHYYVCWDRQLPTRGCDVKHCSARYAPAAQLDELVWRDLCEVITHPESIAEALERAHGGHWLPQELQARRENLRKGRAALKRQLERLTEAYLEEVIPLAEYRRRRKDLENKDEALATQQRQLQAQADRRMEISDLAGSIEGFCERVHSGLANATFEQKRALVQLLIDRVVVSEEKVEIRYVVPLNPRGERTRFCQLRSDYLVVRSRIINTVQISDQRAEKSADLQELMPIL
jgi:site-specific DNA recombinase